MKHILVLPLIALSISLPLQGATSQIRHVEVYPSGASVTRMLAVEAAATGSTAVEVADLPTTLLASSVQIAPQAGSELLVGGFVFLPQENPVTDDDPRTEDLRSAVEIIEEEMRTLRQEKQSIEERIQYFRDVAASIRKSLEEEAGEDAFQLAQNAWKSLEGVRSDGQTRLALIDEEMKALGIRRQKAQKDLDELVNDLRQRAGVLRFDLSGDLSKGASLVIRYQIRQAGWQPVHEIRANPSDGTVRWVYKARIHQNTGEDWEGVQVTLNSASALYAGGLPKLDPLFLNRMEARPMAGRAAPMPSMEQKVFTMDAFEVQAAPEAERASTTTGFYMTLPDPLSLESGKEPAVRTAFSTSLPADFWSEAVPELSTEAWLMAGMTNELGWPILAGESYCYIDGQLVANRSLPEFAAGAEMELALGVNEKIAIERKERVKETSEGGLIDKTKRHELKFETTVENRMPVAHRVILQDRFPIGRDNKIQVRQVQPKDVKPEEGTGIFKWEREIAPGSNVVMTTEYIVTYPAEWTVYPPL